MKDNQSPAELAAPSGAERVSFLRRMGACGARTPEITRRDAFLGAGAMLGGTILFAFLGIVLKRSGFEAFGEALLGVAFPGALLLSLPFTYCKGAPRRTQLLLVGLPFVLLFAIAALAVRI